MNNERTTRSGIRDVVAGLRRRQRMLNALDGAAAGLLVGGVAAVVLAVLGIIAQAPWLLRAPWQLAWCFPAFAIIGAMLGAARRIEDLRVARALDSVASSGDRFASALQLQNHSRQSRAQLVSDDALAAVGTVTPQRALPFRAPRSLKFVPVTAVLAAAVVFFGVGKPTSGLTPAAPEISTDDWREIQKEFSEALEELPKPRDARERELHERLDKLAKSLEKNPEKREILKEIARLRAELDQGRQNLPGKNLSMRQAANSIRASKALQPFAAQLRAGDYSKAADALQALAEKLKQDASAMSAEDFEAAAADLDRMASDLSSHNELNQACKECANAAGSMNREKLSDAFKKFGRSLRNNCDNLRKSDQSCRACNALDRLKNRMNECKSCQSCKDGTCNKPGCSTCNRFVRNSNRKGGLKGGWGTADNWRGGKLSKDSDHRNADVADPRQNAGQSNTYRVISKDEKADSSLSDREVYAEMIKKAEADLSLESVPLAYRDYLRRYFMAIRPSEDDNAPAPAEQTPPSH